MLTCRDLFDLHANVISTPTVLRPAAYTSTSEAERTNYHNIELESSLQELVLYLTSDSLTVSFE